MADFAFPFPLAAGVGLSATKSSSSSSSSYIPRSLVFVSVSSRGAHTHKGGPARLTGSFMSTSLPASESPPFVSLSSSGCFFLPAAAAFLTVVVAFVAALALVVALAAGFAFEAAGTC